MRQRLYSLVANGKFEKVFRGCLAIFGNMDAMSDVAFSEQ